MLEQFVELYPEKASYFELSDTNKKWVFPLPGSLGGVRSRGNTILQVQNVTLKYPTHARNTVENVSLTACIAPRVAVVGANGAGKSTAMKLLISELQPAEGVIWRHQSMRLTYVAQHAVHQLEERQDKIEESWLAPWFIHPKTLDISVEAVSLRLWGNHPRVDNCQKVIVMVCCLLC